MTAQLEQPISAGGVRSLNFFNGRLLTGEDLTREQDGIRRARLRLGEALGEGIAYGLEVTEATGTSSVAAPAVRVEAGLAVNRFGQVLELPCRTDVALTRSGTPGRRPRLWFDDCQVAKRGTYTAGSGVFLLLIGPSRSPEGRAQASGLAGRDATCATAFSVEGVQFRLLRLALPPSVTADDVKLRARVRDTMFGLGDAAAPHPAVDPFGPMPASWGLVDALRAQGDCLSDHELPLAVLHWTATGGLRYVDRWAVRRRVTAPPAAGRWSSVLGDRRAAEAEAMLLGFQDHLEDLRRAAGKGAGVSALECFDRLPPAGLVPVPGLGHPGGFDVRRFFAGITVRGPFFVEGQKLLAILHAALAYPPLEPASREAVWLYQVRENVQSAARHHVVFAGGHTPYAAHAQYDLAHWDFANYALRLS
jgi:hypothetical protein